MNKKYVKRFKRYIRRTLKTKAAALALIAIGILSHYILDDDTVLVFTFLFGIPMFFMNINLEEL